MFRNVTSAASKLWHFLLNIWAFRRELWGFRPWDYEHNYAVFNRSLRLSRDFLSSDLAVTVSAKEHAEEIDFYLREFAMAMNSSEEAAKAVGWNPPEDLSDYIDYAKQNRDLSLFHMQYTEKLESEHWSAAMITLREKSRHWWD